EGFVTISKTDSLTYTPKQNRRLSLFLLSSFSPQPSVNRYINISNHDSKVNTNFKKKRNRQCLPGEFYPIIAILFRNFLLRFIIHILAIASCNSTIITVPFFQITNLT